MAVFSVASVSTPNRHMEEGVLATCTCETNVYIFFKSCLEHGWSQVQNNSEEPWNTDEWLVGWQNRWMKKVRMNGQTGLLIKDRSTDGKMMDRLVDDQKTGGQMDGCTFPESLRTH